MKGTLFSADFIQDSDSNLRLLEFNTDSGFITNTLDTRFDFSGFKTILSDNSIDTLVLIYKGFQIEFVNKLASYIESNATFITTLTRQQEVDGSIYPAAVTDASNKFILRLAYDDNAIFDSTYCKDRANVQKLFYDNSATGSISEYYYSGSDYTANTLTDDINDHDSLPDFVLKTKSEKHLPLKFIKVGLIDSTNQERMEELLEKLDKDTSTLEKYHYNVADISDNKVSGFRTIGILYDTDVKFINIGEWRTESFFDIPTTSEISSVINDNATMKQYSDKHYFQLTSNFVRHESEETIYSEEVVFKNDSSLLKVGDVKKDDNMKSFFINGLPDSDDPDEYRDWSSSGIEFPSDSFITSSIVKSNQRLTNFSDTTNSSHYNTLGEVGVASDEFIYCSPSKHFLVYSTGSNEMIFKQQYVLDPSDHFLVNPSGSLIPIVSNKLVVLESTETGSMHRIDVETTDTYLISSSVSDIIVHNSPCFIAGTKIHTEEGIKNIEDVKIGDKVKTFNHDNDTTEYKEVLELIFKEKENVITYTFENGTELTGTKDHPLYVVGKGYSSYIPQQTLDDSGLVVEQIKVGDEVLHLDNDGVTITEIKEAGFEDVYNLKDVQDNHNFYANDFLVHNRAGGPGCFIAGTEIKLANSDSKNIEDIIVGDEVIGWNDGEFVNSIVTELKPTILGNRNLYNINDLKITFTSEHPFLVKSGHVPVFFEWKSIVPSAGSDFNILEVGNQINHNGEWIEVKEIKELQGDNNTPLYNFTVKDIHSYIADGIVVHNK
jgi:hypothetical protein